MYASSCVCMLSHSVASDSATSWTVTSQAPLSMEFPRQEYWSGLPFPTPGDLPDPRVEPESPALLADSLPLCHLQSPKTSHPQKPFSMFHVTARWETLVIVD